MDEIQRWARKNVGDKTSPGVNMITEEQSEEPTGGEYNLDSDKNVGALGKGGKGGGKGEIICNHCGKKGHILRECREFDKVMEQRRAQGKAKGKGKNNAKGGWDQFSYKGNWSGPKGGKRKSKRRLGKRKLEGQRKRQRHCRM